MTVIKPSANNQPILESALIFTEEIVREPSQESQVSVEEQPGDPKLDEPNVMVQSVIKRDHGNVREPQARDIGIVTSRGGEARDNASSF